MSTGKRPAYPRMAAPLSPEEAGEKKYLTAGGVDTYLTTRLGHAEYAADPKLAKAVERADDAGMPRIAVGGQFGQLMTILVKVMKAARVLEIGTLAGYSTTFFARALPYHGQIDTIEFSPEHARVAQQNFLDLDLYPFPKVHVGRALDVLRDPKGAFVQPPGIADGESPDEAGYDIVFIDANKDEYFEYFQEALRLTRKGGVIVLDNAIQAGRIAIPDNEEQHPDSAGLRKIYDWINEDNGKTVIASAIQTVGNRNWDGFAVIYKQ